MLRQQPEVGQTVLDKQGQRFEVTQVGIRYLRVKDQLGREGLLAKMDAREAEEEDYDAN